MTTTMTTILKFELPSCRDCKELAKLVDRLTSKHLDIRVETHNLMLSLEARQRRVQVVPTVIVLKDGLEFARIERLPTMEELEAICT